MARAKKNNGDDILTAQEAAALLRIKPRELHKKRRLGLVEGIKVGHRTVHYEKSAIEDLARRLRQSGRGDRQQRPLFSADDELMPRRF